MSTSVLIEDFVVEELDFDSELACESIDAHPVHGDGEKAVAWLHLTCPACGHSDDGLIGAACVTYLQFGKKIDGDYPCDGCGHAFPIRTARLTPL